MEMEPTEFDRFVAHLINHTNGNVLWAAPLARKMVRLAKKHQHYQGLLCNRELTPGEVKADLKVEEQLRVIVKEEIGKGCTVRFMGDPRGYTVRLLGFDDDAFNTWGGKESGYGVPTSVK